MKKIITFTIMAIATFSWFVTCHITEPEKNLPTNAPFTIKSNQPGTCRVSIMGATADTEKKFTHHSVQGTKVVY